MPHKTRTLESGEKVPSMVLSSGFKWKDKLPEINNVNLSLQLQHISASRLSNIRRQSFPESMPPKLEVTVLHVVDIAIG